MRFDRKTDRGGPAHERLSAAPAHARPSGPPPDDASRPEGGRPPGGNDRAASSGGKDRAASPAPPDPRYSRQTLFQEIGEEGQRRLGGGRALVVGCGALGCTIAEHLVRAGVGHVRIVDRDLVERTNLQRQTLFDESDAAGLLPKAEAAAARLRRINSDVAVEGIVADLTSDSVGVLAAGAAVLVDGTDNFETRFLLNDWAVREGVPWIYGAAVGSYGVTMSVLPGEGACLTCVFETAPPPGTSPTCDTAGILAPISAIIGSLEALEAIKLLAGRKDRMSDALTVIDVWEGRFDRMKVPRRLDPPCATCVERRFPHLSGEGRSRSATLCGRNSVQVSPPPGTRIDLEALAARLAAAGTIEKNRFLVRATLDGHEITIFGDGRAIVSGTTEAERARALYARYVGV